MAFTNPWDESDPPGGQDANTADTEIQQVKVDVRERIETVLPGWADDLEDPKIFPGWRLTKSDTVALADSTVDGVVWTTEDRDTDGFIVVPSRPVVIPVGLGGLYIIGGAMGWDINTIGIRRFDFFIGGVRFDVDRREGVVGASTFNRLSVLADLSDGDLVQFEVFQTSGGILDYGNVDANESLVNFWGIRLGGF